MKRKTHKSHPYFIEAYLHPGHPFGNKKSNKFRKWRYLTHESMGKDLVALKAIGMVTIIKTS